MTLCHNIPVYLLPNVQSTFFLTTNFGCVTENVTEIFLISVLSDVESPPGPGVGSVKPETVDTVPSVTDQATRDQVELMVSLFLLVVLCHPDHFSN